MEQTNAALEIVPNPLKYSRLTNAVPVIPNIGGVINMVPLRCIVESLLREMTAPLPQQDQQSAIDGEGVLRFVHEMGDINVPLFDLKSYMDAETGNSAVQLPPDEWARKASQAGMDEVLVAFFGKPQQLSRRNW